MFSFATPDGTRPNQAGSQASRSGRHRVCTFVRPSTHYRLNRTSRACGLFHCLGRANFSASCFCEGVSPCWFYAKRSGHRFLCFFPCRVSSSDDITRENRLRASDGGEPKRKDQVLEIQVNMSACRRAVIARPGGSRSDPNVGR